MVLGRLVEQDGDSIILPTLDGVRLFLRESRPASVPHGVVCILHGLGEHGGRYDRITKGLTDAGFVTFVLDLRGNGRSEGRRGHTPSYQHLLRDTDRLLTHALQRYPGRLLFLHGHSFGGNIAINHALRNPFPHLAGVIATAPWLRLTHEITMLRVVLAQMVQPVCPWFSVSTAIDRPKLELGPYPDAFDQRDPLGHQRITMRTFLSTRAAGRWAVKNAASLPVPALVLHGELDDVTDPMASHAFAMGANGLCEYHVLPRQYHNLHEQADLTPFTRLLTGWLERQAERYAADPRRSSP